MARTTGVLDEKSIGIWYVVGAFITWGILPLYWKLFKQISAGEILAHRILWSFVFVAIMLIYQGRLKTVKEVILNPSSLLKVLLSSLLISSNWFIYIWAVNTEKVIEASLGYYINPLLTVALGVIVLRERLSFWQLISFVIAVIGVLIMTIQYGMIPWVAISLALTFALYSLAKKTTKLESMTAVAVETLLVTPLALGYIIYKQAIGLGSIGNVPLGTTVMLMFSGILTALPLLWFAQGAKRVPLSTVGFIQYLSPTISLFLGIFVFRESFTTTHMFSFALIWVALALYSMSQTSFFQTIQSKVFRRTNYSN